MELGFCRVAGLAFGISGVKADKDLVSLRRLLWYGCACCGQRACSWL